MKRLFLSGRLSITRIEFGTAESTEADFIHAATFTGTGRIVVTDKDTGSCN